MNNLLKVFCRTFLLILIVTASAFAGNGKIAGVVKDNAGKPIVGVTVMLEGTRIGAAADIDGRYFILNIPPGKYDVTFSAVGYKKRIIRDVKVSSDATTDLNAALEDAAVQVSEIVVEAERKLVDKTLTSTKSTISADELSNSLPVSSAYEILQTTPSVFQGYVRGGKQNQTKTIVEGVDVSDNFYAAAADASLSNVFQTYNMISRYAESQTASAVNVNQNSVSELTVNTGALGADYASATGGVINYSLKEGRGSIGGKLYLRTSAKKLGYVGPAFYGDDSLYFKEKASLLAAGDASSLKKAKNFTYQTGMYEMGQQSIEADLSLFGSISEDLGFYLSSNLKDNPWSRYPNQKYRELNTQLKLNYNLTSEIKLVALGILTDKGKLFGWKNTSYSETARFFLNGIPQRDGMTWVGSLKMTHFLANNTFYEVQISNKNIESRIGFVDGNNDGFIDLNEKGDFIKFEDTATVNRMISDSDPNKFFAYIPQNVVESQTSSLKGINNGAYKLAKPGPFYEDVKFNDFTAKVDFTSQVTYNHQLKAGLNYVLHTYEMDRKAGFIGSTLGGVFNFDVEKWKVKPTEFSAYIQDRMEYAGLVINVGARADMWDPKVGDFANYFKPFGRDSLYDAIDNLYFYLKSPIRGENVKPTWFVSPNIAVSHPISDKAAIYFSFTKKQQPQAYSMIYTDLYDVGNASLPQVAYVNRAPYKTTNYEMGGQWEFVERYLSLNVNAYYKDIENYVSTSFNVANTATVSSPSNYYVQFNTGYADTRGVEVQIDALPIDVYDVCKLSGRLSYTYSYVKGSVIFSNFKDNPFTFTTASGDSAKYGPGLPFNDVQYYRKYETNISGTGSSLTAGYDRAHRVGFTLFARFPYEISLTSIGKFASGFYYVKKYTDPRVAGRLLVEGPWNAQVDLRIEKAFSFGGKYRAAIFADIKNIFNKSNVLAYDNTNTYDDKWEERRDPTGMVSRPIGVDGSPYYDIPREVYFGLSIDF